MRPVMARNRHRTHHRRCPFLGCRYRDGCNVAGSNLEEGSSGCNWHHSLWIRVRYCRSDCSGRRDSDDHFEVHGMATERSVAGKFFPKTGNLFPMRTKGDRRACRATMWVLVTSRPAAVTSTTKAETMM